MTAQAELSFGRGAVAGFERVRKEYGDKVAVAEVSFSVRPAEVFGLLGPNGAGKTTLLRILLDILRPTSGRAWLFGRPLERAALDRVSYLPEERGLYTKQKVIDVLAYFGTLKGLEPREARRRGLAWLARVELADVARHRVERLSKGMGQKVQIAGALLNEPELCVLDEPFSGLDPVNVRLVKDLILERRAQGRTTILSTHQMNLVEELCDRVALVHDGRLVVHGAVADVRRAASTRSVRVEVRGELPAVAGVLEARPEGSRRHVLVLAGETAPGEVLRTLVRAGAEVVRFEEVLASMEDVFLRAVAAPAAPASPGEAAAS